MKQVSWSRGSDNGYGSNCDNNNNCNNNVRVMVHIFKVIFGIFSQIFNYHHSLSFIPSTSWIWTGSKSMPFTCLKSTMEPPECVKSVQSQLYKQQNDVNDVPVVDFEEGSAGWDVKLGVERAQGRKSEGDTKCLFQMKSPSTDLSLLQAMINGGYGLCLSLQKALVFPQSDF